MAQRASIRDVASAAGVSIKTVSRVINGVPTVDPAIRARVETAARDLHYVPNSMARSLKTGSSNVVGFVVDSLDDGFFSSLMSAVETAAVERGFEVLIASTGHDPAREREQVLRLIGHGVQGVVLAPAGDEHEYLTPHRGAMPVVAVDRPLPGFDSVTIDDYAAARRGTELLIEGGHRRIGFLGWDRSFSTSERRHQAYADVLAEHGIEVVPELEPLDLEPVDAVTAVLAVDPPPTALFLSRARGAPEVVADLHRRGRTDLAVISFGDFALADTVSPSITCIDQDPYEIGSLAVDRLLALIEAPGIEPVERIVAARFILRESHRLVPGTRSDLGGAA